MFLMYFLHYFLGIASVVLAVLVAGKPFPVPESSVLYKGLATTLAAVTGVVALSIRNGSANAISELFGR